MSATSIHARNRYQLTREWGERWASVLWKEFLGNFEVEWSGAQVLDFGCAAGYLPVHLVQLQGVAEAHGVDLHPVWESMIDGFRPDGIAGVHLHCGNVLELPALQGLRFDVIVTSGTLHMLKPALLTRVLRWFHDHLKPGGRCLVATRTFAHHDGADLGHRAPAFSHLLFGQSEITQFLERSRSAAPHYVNPSCAATYLVQFIRAGFLIEQAERLHEGVDEDPLRQHKAKLRWLDPQELRTSGLQAALRRPVMPDLSIVDQIGPR